MKVSGRLRRPWPDLSAMTLPGFTPGLLAAAIAGSFLPDLPGMLAGVLAASLFMAYAIMGFAVLHAITRGMGGRTVRAHRRLCRRRRFRLADPRDVDARARRIRLQHPRPLRRTGGGPPSHTNLINASNHSKEKNHGSDPA